MSRTPGNAAGRTGRAWREARARCLNASNICGICGDTIDMTLSGRHLDGPTVNHKVPMSLGGAPLDVDNLEPAHNRCNSGQRERVTKPVRSREW